MAVKLLSGIVGAFWLFACVGCSTTNKQHELIPTPESFSVEECEVVNSWILALVGDTGDKDNVLAPFHKAPKGSWLDGCYLVLEKNSVNFGDWGSVPDSFDPDLLADCETKTKARINQISNMPKEMRVLLFNHDSLPTQYVEFWNAFHRQYPKAWQESYWHISRVGFNAVHTQAVMSFWMVREPPNCFEYLVCFTKKDGKWNPVYVDRHH